MGHILWSLKVLTDSSEQIIHVTFFTYCQTAVSMYNVHLLIFLSVYTRDSSISSPLKLSSNFFVLGVYVYQCPTTCLFVSFYCFHLSFSLKRGQPSLKTVLNYNSVCHIFVRRCYFRKFLT